MTAIKADLNERLIAAHLKGDRADLVELYSEAADWARGRGDLDAECFFLTHAWIFALEYDDPAAADLRDRLATLGRL